MEKLFANLGIDWRLLLAQAVNFLLVVWLLNHFVFKRVISHLENRRNQIEQGLQITERAKREMERIEEARHRELEKARKEAEKVLAQARSSTLAKEKAALAIVRAEAEKILLGAKEQAQKEKHDAVRRAQTEVQKLAVLIAEKILARSVNKEDQERAAREVMSAFQRKYVVP